MESEHWSDSLSAANSSSSMHVSTTSRKMGGIVCERVIVYSIVEKRGISSAGWCCSEMAAY